MEPESGTSASRNPSQLSWVNLSRNLILAYQSFGVVYGDLSTSPLYVFTSAFRGKLLDHYDEETIFGTFSLIFWTLTLIPLLKYVFILLSADDNGEGGTFALYSLLCRHAKFNLLPNQQAADEELSSYKYGPSSQAAASSPLKRFLEKHKRLRTALLVVVLFGACMVIGDGVLTPAISVLASVSGLKVTEKKLTDGELVLLACVILVGLFALQHCGTHKVAFMFAPIVIIWLVSIFSVGLYNTIHWNPQIVRAISPYYIIKFFSKTGKEGWVSLGGILLCITGTEAMYADLGHFTASSIRLAFAFVIYPCLVVQYMGQAAFLSKNLNSVDNSFYDSIPEPVFWPVFVIATLAAIVGSQAVITATFSIIKQCHALGCFPRVKVVHTSKHIYGQIYIPEINWILMILTLAITIGFQDTTIIGNAYGLACMTVMFVTTFLMTLVAIFVWQKSVFIAIAFLLFFWVIEGVYLSAAFIKVPQGGWVPVPYVSPEERFLIGRVCPRPYRMYRCIVRYGYKDIQRDDGDFENHLIQSIAEFIQMEAVEPQFSSSEASSLDGRMAVISSRNLEYASSLIVSEQEDIGVDISIPSSRSVTLRSLQSVYDDESPQVRRRRVRFQLPENPGMNPDVKEELLDLIQAKDAGVAYIMGHSYVKARKSSSFLKKLVIDIGYSFLRKNCRGPAVALNIPHISLIEVGMIYYV
ncbi:potassium transporter 4 isoform X2 [Vigna umbellata]|uniref:potassium transporter 4 isoform X2 n=1 Tax=Vigna umbellata TaxID=87088 RepID=UPI001F5F5AF9|nr:potassium transporter 4 isoform X2 [Vigna umbellata]